MCMLKKMARKLQIFSSLFLNSKCHFFFPPVTNCTEMWVEDPAGWKSGRTGKKNHLFPYFCWKLSLIYLSKTSVMPPVHSSLCSWHPPCPMGYYFWHLPASLWHCILVSESKGLGGLWGCQVKINPGNIYTFPTVNFPWRKEISKQLQFTVLCCTRGFKTSDLLVLVNIGQVTLRDENST